MLKRLSYPLSWMETLGGEKDEDKPPSHPHSAADVHHSSVFSKVFSRWVRVFRVQVSLVCFSSVVQLIGVCRVILNNF